MDSQSEFNVDIIAKGLNDIQNEKRRNEYQLKTEENKSNNLGIEVEKATQELNGAEKQLSDSNLELETLKIKNKQLEAQRSELIVELGNYKQEIEMVTDDTACYENQHKKNLAMNFKVLDEILAKFRDSKTLLLHDDISKQVRELEDEYNKLQSELTLSENCNTMLFRQIREMEVKLESCLRREDMINEDALQASMLYSYFKAET